MFTSTLYITLYIIIDEEGFNLLVNDPDYHAWLAIHRPETQSSYVADSLVTHGSGTVDAAQTHCLKC